MTSTSLKADSVLVPAGEGKPFGSHYCVAPIANDACDWSGLWFKVIQDTSGEFVGMRGGKLLANGEICWTFLSHATYDGLGGFVHLLRQQPGSEAVQLPRRKMAKPSWIARVWALFNLLLRPTKAAAAWTGIDPNWRPTGARDSDGKFFATELLDVERTRWLTETARKHGVPLNSFLLSALGRSCQSELHGGPAIWMMPVNMRGPVALPRDTANQTGYLHIEVGHDATPSHIQKQVKLALHRRDHWATWIFLNTGRFVGHAGIRWIYRLQMARFNGRPFVGSFTNLGRWDGHGEWFVCPPVVRTCPVGVGVIICNGRLSLTIEAHPSMIGGASWTRAVMDRWLNELSASSRTI